MKYGVHVGKTFFIKLNVSDILNQLESIQSVYRIKLEKSLASLIELVLVANKQLLKFLYYM